MKTQTIEVEGLPEGWKPVSYGWPKKNVDYVFDGLVVKLFIGKEDHAMMIVEKIQPRRIVLEETDEVRAVNPGEWFMYEDDGVVTCRCKHTPSIDEFRIWREVKETDIPLHNEEPKLSLGVDDCKSLVSTNDNYAAYHKIQQFIKENS